MKTRIPVLAGMLLLITQSVGAASGGAYVANISFVQVTDIGHPYNAIHLEVDITDSLCTSTNQYDRFAITNEAQLSAALAAAMADKEVRVYGSGNCNPAGIETLGNIRIYP